MKKKALKKEFRREVRKSLNRFLSIFFIVAMGVAFYSGIYASAPDMRATGDYYFDQSKLMDLRVISTLGLSEEDLEILGSLEGTERAVGCYMEDVLCGDLDAQSVLHLESIADEMNLLTPEEGRLPQKEDECFLDASFAQREGYEVGAELRITVSDEESSTLKYRSFTISGIGYSPCYISSSRGSTTLGNGSVAGFVYVLPEAFDTDIYSVVYIKAEGADDAAAFDDVYEKLVDRVYDQVKDIAGDRCEIRYAAVMEEAQSELEEARQEIADGKVELEDAKKELEDGEAEAQSELDEAQSELLRGEAELEDGRAELTQAYTELEDGEAELTDAQTQIEEQEESLESAQKQLQDAHSQLVQGEAEYEQGMQSYQTSYQQAVKELEQAQKEIDTGKGQLVDGWSTYEANRKELENGQKQLKAAEEVLDASQAEYDAQYEATKAQLDAGMKAYEAGAEVLEQGKTSYEAAKQELTGKQQEYEAGAEALADSRQEYAAGTAQQEADQESYRQAQQQAESLAQECVQQQETLAALQETYEAAQQQNGTLREAYKTQKETVNALQLSCDMLAADAQTQRTLQREAEEKQQSLLEQAQAAETEEERAALIAAAQQEGAKAADAMAAAQSLEQEYQQAQSQLEAAQSTFSQQKETLDVSDAAVTQQKAAVEAAADSLAAKQAELEERNRTLSQQKESLDQNEQNLAQTKAALDLQEEILSAAKTELDQGWSQLDGSWQELQDREEQLNAAKEELENGYAELEAAAKQLADAAAQLEEKKAALSAGEAELEKGKAQLEASEAQLAAAQKEVDAGYEGLKAAGTSLSAARSELDLGWAQLSASQTQLRDGETQLADAKAQLSDARSQLSEARRKLEEAQKELKDNEEKLEDGWEEYEEGKLEAQKKVEDAKAEMEEAEQELRDAELEVADAQKELEKIKVPTWYVDDRAILPEYSGFDENAERIANLGRVFPVIFFLVAALISLTTMTRMVEEERTQIGTMKALGYSKMTIASKYLNYALYATVGGSLFGVLFGEKVFPWVVIFSYSIIYEYIPKIVIPYNWEYGLIAAGAALFCTMGATFSACRKALREVPAQLMRPPAPKDGKRIILEYFPFFWSRLGFNWKSTIRNLMRYKKRCMMTVIGIAGCMGLLLVGYGLKDSIMGIGQMQFEELQLYDAMVILNTDEDEDAQQEALEAFAEEPKIEQYDRYYMQLEELQTEGISNKSWNLYVYVPQEVSRIGTYFTFRDRETGETYKLTDEGAIVTEKLADEFGIRPGDTILLKREGEADVEVPIAQICENYLSHYLYLTPALYEQLYGEAPKYNTVLFRAAGGVQEIGKTLLKQAAVLNITYVTDLMEQIEDMLGALDLVIVVLILAAGALAFVVLYNLNNININERQRELATLKVLGFHDLEAAAYVYRENILLTIAGALAGILVGKFLHAFIITTVEVESCMFARTIKPISFLYGILFTFLFSIIVNFVMYFKIRKIDMVESLKSIE